MAGLDLQKHFSQFRSLLQNETLFENLLEAQEIIESCHSAGGRLFICGNGGSFGTAAHLVTDFSKQAKIPSLTIQDSAMTSALANDLGFEDTIVIPFQQHSDNVDVLMILSVSGKSPNLIKAANFARNRGNKIITFTGHSPSSPLAKIADVNFFVDSYGYNIVESLHLIWSTTLIDMIIGDSVYDVSGT